MNRTNHQNQIEIRFNQTTACRKGLISVIKTSDICNWDRSKFNIFKFNSVLIGSE